MKKRTPNQIKASHRNYVLMRIAGFMTEINRIKHFMCNTSTLKTHCNIVHESLEELEQEVRNSKTEHWK